jgi:hypothetical protein
MVSIVLGSVTLVRPIIGGKNPTSDSEVILIDGTRDQDEEVNYGDEINVTCQSESFSDYEAILGLIGTGPHELVIDWSFSETPNTESLGYYIVSNPLWDMPNISAWCPWFVYKFTLRRQSAVEET